METSVRLLRLLTLLQVRREWSGAELAERLAVTTRTVRTDVERLRVLGYRIESHPGVAGGYRLGAGSALPPLLLDDDEAVAVAVGLRAAAGGSVTGIEETSLRALAKLEQSLPSRLRHRVDALRAATVSAAGGGPTVGADRADWRTFRADRIRPRVPTGPRFTLREPPGGDAVAHVLRGVGSTAWPHPARVRLHASAERMAQRIPTTAGLLEAIDGQTCLLHTGGESLGNLAVFLGTLEVDFDVLDPPELRAVIRDVATRFGRAAQVS